MRLTEVELPQGTWLSIADRLGKVSGSVGIFLSFYLFGRDRNARIAFEIRV
ncbi:hypothetical protein HMPREF1039_0731 [Megasphaera lornae]|uniref:Uncharacterized protein n=1 Tax=Megasphaera lornae TaxID=1000568 RepID=D3LWM9_9FIRM|nr:hypothetical protein HMPREF0889_0686 [Megasphaera genomosp. type_1 str. 28L]EGL40257.1 hypothetical protein HMPREF1039_0731 [Megasphaera lornae]